MFSHPAVPQFKRLLIACCALAFVIAGCGESATSTKKTATTTNERSAEKTSVETTAAPPVERVRIGAWNIEWLGTPENRSGPAKNNAQQAADLADYIMAANVSILGLEEIARDDTDGSWTNSTLTKTFEFVNEKTGGKWKHRLSPANSGRNQVCGIAWDETRVHPRGELRPVLDSGAEVDGARIWSRPPPAMTFTVADGYTDFVVIDVHMKSNYGGNFAKVRGQEAQALAEAAPQTFHDGDLVIIGDTNCNKHSEPGPQALDAAGWVDLNASDIPTFWQGTGALDRIFVPKNQAEFNDRHFEVFRDAFLKSRHISVQEFKKRYSDHFMVISDVHIQKDDD